MVQVFSYLYIYIPILIFLWGWTKWWIAGIVTAAIIYCGYRFYRDIRESSLQGHFSIDIKVLVGAIIFLTIVGFFAGWGNFVPQARDWYKHNALINDLTNKTWPIYYTNGDEHSMLSYYIAQYLLPAFFGKIAGSVRVTELVSLPWNVLGLVLVFLNTVRVLKIKRGVSQLIAIVMIAFFACPELLGQVVLEIFYPGMGDVGNIGMFTDFSADTTLKIYYYNNFALLRWSYPQAIVLWLTIVLFFEHRKSIGHYVFIALPAMLFGIMTFLGLVPLMVVTAFYYIVRGYKDRCASVYRTKIISDTTMNDISDVVSTSEMSHIYCSGTGSKSSLYKKLCGFVKYAISRLASISNLVMTATLGGVLLAYYYGNVFCEKPESIGFQLIDYSGNEVIYFIFIGTYVLPLFIYLVRANIRNVIFMCCSLALVVIPFFYMGLYNDFVIKCSSASIFVYCMCSIHALDRVVEEARGMTEIRKLKSLGFVIVLCSGLAISIAQFSLAVIQDATSGEAFFERYSPENLMGYYVYDEQEGIVMVKNQPWTTLEDFANRSNEGVAVDLRHNYYAYDVEENLFYKYIARVRY